MSASAPSKARPRVEPRGTQAARAGLRLVAPVRVRAARTPFVVVVMTVVAAGLTGLILISTVLQSQSFELSRLQADSSSLSTRQDALSAEVAKERSPSAIADAALELGMVPSATPVFLNLSKGSVVGKPKAASSNSNLDGAE